MSDKPEERRNNEILSAELRAIEYLRNARHCYDVGKHEKALEYIEAAKAEIEHLAKLDGDK